MANANLTRNGICYDLKVSPYELEVEYEEQLILYKFSSILNRNKFIAQASDNRKRITASLSNRFGFINSNDVLSDLVLYNKLEKRGFYVKLEIENEEILCLSDLELIGTRVVRKN